MSRGQHSMIKKDYDQAAMWFGKSIEASPGKENAAYDFKARVQVLKSHSLFEKNDYKKAIQELDTLLESKDKEKVSGQIIGEAYSLRGAIHNDSGNFENAVSDLTNALALSPDNALYYYIRSITYKNIKETAKSEADLKKAKELDSAIETKVHTKIKNTKIKEQK